MELMHSSGHRTWPCLLCFALCPSYRWSCLEDSVILVCRQLFLWCGPSASWVSWVQRYIASAPCCLALGSGRHCWRRILVDRWRSPSFSSKTKWQWQFQESSLPIQQPPAQLDCLSHSWPTVVPQWLHRFLAQQLVWWVFLEESSFQDWSQATPLRALLLIFQLFISELTF